jgi:hypothetical protein
LQQQSKNAEAKKYEQQINSGLAVTMTSLLKTRKRFKKKFKAAAAKAQSDYVVLVTELY